MKRRRLIWAGVLLFIGVVCWFSLSRRTGAIGSPTVVGNVPLRPQNSAGVANAEPGITGLSMSRDQDRITHLIMVTLEAMRRGKSAEVDAVLVQLDEVLGSKRGNAEPGITAILQFLKTGKDAATGRGFVVGDGGVLMESTTLRVYLMDKLGQLSREVGSEAASGVAREVLQSFGSADEWAVSMRNVAWFDPVSRSFLQDRIQAMLNHREWQDQPSIGMLESFDVIVHTGAMLIVPELSRLISAQNSPLSRASSVALDRISGQHGLELTSFLNQNPQLLSAAPLVRADLFAHADLSIPEQRDQLESYLLRPDVDIHERKKFFSSLVQTGQFLSNNLITPVASAETPAQAVARLDILIQTVNGWLRDERFNTLNGDLTSLGARVNRILDEITADENSK